MGGFRLIFSNWISHKMLEKWHLCYNLSYSYNLDFRKQIRKLILGVGKKWHIQIELQNNGLHNKYGWEIWKKYERNMNKYERNMWEIRIAMGCTTNMVEKYESAPGLEPICGQTKAIWGQKWNADVCKIFGWNPSRILQILTKSIIRIRPDINVNKDTLEISIKARSTLKI